MDRLSEASPVAVLLATLTRISMSLPTTAPRLSEELGKLSVLGL